MKKLFIYLCILLLMAGCSPGKNDFYARKYPTEKGKSYYEKRGLMILNNTYLGKNKEFYSKHNTQARMKRQTRNKKYKRINKKW